SRETRASWRRPRGAPRRRRRSRAGVPNAGCHRSSSRRVRGPWPARSAGEDDCRTDGIAGRARLPRLDSPHYATAPVRAKAGELLHNVPGMAYTASYSEHVTTPNPETESVVLPRLPLMA